MRLLLVVAAALIDPDGRVLVTERPPGKQLAGSWEFPGGKVEPGERPEETLMRELAEELGIAVEEPCLAPLTFASHAYESFHLLMPLYVCRRWSGFAQGLEGQRLAWVRPRELRAYPMPPADEPLIPPLIELVGAAGTGLSRSGRPGPAVRAASGQLLDRVHLVRVEGEVAGDRLHGRMGRLVAPGHVAARHAAGHHSVVAGIALVGAMGATLAALEQVGRDVLARARTGPPGSSPP